MGLIGRVLAVALSLALRIGVLLVVLFAAHLLVTSALPHWRRVADAIERKPIIEQQLRDRSSDLEQERRELRSLEQRLDTLSAAKLRDLGDELQRWQLRLEELSDERDRLLGQLDDMRRERDEYCTSYN